MVDRAKTSSKRRANVALAAGLAAVFVGLIGATFAVVPLYGMFRQATGYGGTTRTVTQSHAGTILARTIEVRFDANTFGGLPWRFAPLERKVTVQIGASAQVEYVATNLSDHATTGRPSLTVTPERTGAYFDKVECDCRISQTLAPGETRKMKIAFYVDPAIVTSDMKDVRTITLSYTMFAGETPKPVASAERMKSASAGEL